MSYSSTKTWISTSSKELEAFSRFNARNSRIAPKSAFAPSDWTQWFDHRQWEVKKLQVDISLLLLRKLADRTMREKGLVVKSAFAGKQFCGNLSPVLCMKTIWTATAPDREHAPWPAPDELRHEGHGRTALGLRRFPPLPRVPAKGDVNWWQRVPIVPYPLDNFVHSTWTEDEEAEDEEVDYSDDFVFYIGEGLLRELEA